MGRRARERRQNTGTRREGAVKWEPWAVNTRIPATSRPPARRSERRSCVNFLGATHSEDMGVSDTRDPESQTPSSADALLFGHLHKGVSDD